MSIPDFKEKFIGFVDVLGFKSMVEAAENGTGRTLTEIQELLSELGREKDAVFFKKYGPQTCPESACLRKDLDFQVTQVSDCAIVSSEISPAGVINLVAHCWRVALVLLANGVMVRGYITRGKIHHNGNEFMGTGYNEAYRREGEVTAFKRDASDRGTPFVEVDPALCEYVRNETDNCVREMFSRFVKDDGEVTAVFPFQRLEHFFMIGGWGVPTFDPAKEKESNNTTRQTIIHFKNQMTPYLDQNNEDAVRKAEHYIAALDAQLLVCDQTGEMIDKLS